MTDDVQMPYDTVPRKHSYMYLVTEAVSVRYPDYPRVVCMEAASRALEDWGCDVTASVAQKLVEAAITYAPKVVDEARVRRAEEGH